MDQPPRHRRRWDPTSIRTLVTRVGNATDCELSIHCPNDFGLAVANSLAAVEAGARMAQVSLNAIGERAGNADLCAVIPNLALKMGVSVLDEHPERLPQLTRLSRTVSELANLEHNPRLPFVGKHSFTHKGGAHVNAMLKTTKSFGISRRKQSATRAVTSSRNSRARATCSRRPKRQGFLWALLRKLASFSTN